MNKTSKGLIVLFLFFCELMAAQKVEYDVINDFIAIELKDLTYDSIHIRKESYSMNEMINLYERAYKGRHDQSSSYTDVWTYPELSNWPFDTTQILNIKKTLKLSKKEWTEKDFRNKNFIFKNKVLLNDKNFISSHLDLKEYFIVLSEPIYSDDKKSAIFYFYLTSMYLGFTPTPHKGVIVMKKENGKWIALASIREAVYE